MYDQKVESELWKWEKEYIERQKVEQWRVVEYTCQESSRGTICREKGD